MAKGRIKLLGKPAILDADGQSQSVRGHQAWALLARILLARQPLDRRALSEELFFESVDPLGSLRWCLASLRKALNTSDCLLGDPIEQHLPAGFKVDVWLLGKDALALDDMGPLLDGIDPQCSAAFSTWLLVERTRISAAIDDRIRRETMRTLATQDYEYAVRLAERAVCRDVYNESAHILLVKALVLARNPDAALKHVEATERLFQEELGVAPTRALRSAARQAIAAPPAGIRPEAQVKSLMESGSAALIAGAVDAGIENLRHAVSEAEKTGDQHLLAAATLKLGKGLVHAVRGFDDEGSVLLRQCAEIAGPRGYGKIASAAFTELGYVEALAGCRPAAGQYLRSAQEFAADADDLAAIHSVLAFNLVDWGKVDKGLEHYAISLDQARLARNRHAEMWSLGLGAWGQLAAGRLDEAEAWLGDCLELVDEYRWVSFRPWPVALLGETTLRRRRPSETLRPPLEEAYALSRQLRDPCWEAAVARSLALTFAADGKLEVAGQWLDEAYGRCVREADPYVGLKVEILANKVKISHRLGQGEIASALAREWISLSARSYMDAHVERAAAYLAGRHSF